MRSVSSAVVFTFNCILGVDEPKDKCDVSRLAAETFQLESKVSACLIIALGLLVWTLLVLVIGLTSRARTVELAGA